MDTKTSTLSTNTNSPVAVGPVNSNYRMDRGAQPTGFFGQVSLVAWLRWHLFINSTSC